MPPGPELAGALAAIDVTGLSGVARVSVLIAHRRLVSHYQAEMYRDIAAVESWMRAEGQSDEVAIDAAGVEVGAALQLTRRRAESETRLARELAYRLPRVLRALRSGDIDLARARVLVYDTDHLPADTARRVVDLVIDDATRLTPGQLRARLRRRCIEADPGEAAERYERSLADRRVYATPSVDGTSHLWGFDLPPDRVAAITRYLDEEARRRRGAGEERTMDQLRADLFLEILEGSHTRGHTSNGGVHLYATVETLAELQDAPAELAGYGPVIAEVARRVADEQARSRWTYTVCDPVTGDIVSTGVVRRRPTRPQRRRIRARYPTCAWPGCRVPSVDCDLDHIAPWDEGGCTHDHNLGPLCRFHHRIRHQAGWAYRRLPNGDHEWTTRTGRRIVTRNRPPP